ASEAAAMIEIPKISTGSALKTTLGTGMPGAAGAGAAGGASTTGFADALQELVSTVETNSAKANTAVTQMFDGSGDVHDAMIALQRAEMSLQLTVQLRNKLMAAYNDIMKMPV